MKKTEIKCPTCGKTLLTISNEEADIAMTCTGCGTRITVRTGSELKHLKGMPGCTGWIMWRPAGPREAE